MRDFRHFNFIVEELELPKNNFSFYEELFYLKIIWLGIFFRKIPSNIQQKDWSSYLKFLGDMQLHRSRTWQMTKNNFGKIFKWTEFFLHFFLFTKNIFQINLHLSQQHFKDHVLFESGSVSSLLFLRNPLSLKLSLIDLKRFYQHQKKILWIS